jgi:hypothetical protein
MRKTIMVGAYDKCLSISLDTKIGKKDSQNVFLRFEDNRGQYKKKDHL